MGQTDRQETGVAVPLNNPPKETVLEGDVLPSEKAIADADERIVEDCRAAIHVAWQKNLENILNVGRMLVQVKSRISRGRFAIMVNDELPFGARTAQMLMTVAEDKRIANAKHASHLPPSWMTLYNLTRLTDAEFEFGVDAGMIRPDLQRKHIRLIKDAASKSGSAGKEKKKTAKDKENKSNPENQQAETGQATIDEKGPEQFSITRAEAMFLRRAVDACRASGWVGAIFDEHWPDGKSSPAFGPAPDLSALYARLLEISNTK